MWTSIGHSTDVITLPLASLPRVIMVILLHLYKVTKHSLKAAHLLKMVAPCLHIKTNPLFFAPSQRLNFCLFPVKWLSSLLCNIIILLVYFKYYKFTFINRHFLTFNRRLDIVCHIKIHFQRTLCFYRLNYFNSIHLWNVTNK